MPGTVSVKEALKRGDKMITNQSNAFFAIIFFPYFIFILVNTEGLNSGVLLFSGFFIISLIVGFYTNLQIVKWRTWAFANVAEINELTSAAIAEGFVVTPFIWRRKQTGFISSPAEMKIPAAHPGNHQTNDNFNDDLSLGPEINITFQYDLKYLFLTTGFISFIVILASAFAFNLKGLLIPLPILAFSIWQYRQRGLRGRKPQITLSNCGIQSVKYGFRHWSTVIDPEIISVENSETTEYYLQYVYGNKTETISLNYMDVSNRQLNHLIYVYYNRGRLDESK